ncbi:hypothetical protein IE53DRAFT_121874 [Violaceomyces palustris]|uniref:Uncharacterized protein n=1 Tax=Violaceomyces palustris TaxID=1673888 RepID=A0ACD0P6L7_9BASI|nr:hypothetical protein IE53DRAFT_121874 [Violaceomyces palustris]
MSFLSSFFLSSPIASDFPSFLLPAAAASNLFDRWNRKKENEEERINTCEVDQATLTHHFPQANSVEDALALPPFPTPPLLPHFFFFTFCLFHFFPLALSPSLRDSSQPRMSPLQVRSLLGSDFYSTRRLFIIAACPEPHNRM